MKRNRRLGSLLLTGVMLAGIVLPAGAASYSDLPESHWAYEKMTQASELGLLSGIGGGRMGPSNTLTWGQCLVMVSKAFSPSAYARAQRQGLAWDMVGYTAAVDGGLLEEDDFLPVTEETLDQPITRAEVAVMLARVIPEEADYRYSNLYGNGDASENLTDWAYLDRDYRESVSRLYGLGVISGMPDGSFSGDNTLQRADGSVMLMQTLKFVDLMSINEPKDVTVRFVDENGASVGSAETLETYVGRDLYWLVDEYIPTGYGYQSGADSVSTACDDYTITLRTLSKVEAEEALAFEQLSNGEITEDEFYMKDFWLIYPGENYRKYQLLFGTTEKRRFSSRAEAEANMTSITVPVWKLSNGKKVASTASFTIHAAIAEDVKEILTEIYNDPEQFPIHDIGGYSWRGDSATGEHNCGTAIDINANENYQVRDGQAMVGSCWQPGSNAYSIPENGSVVRIFAEHGWSWGGDAWAWDTDQSTGYHDYMHFSYMGG